MALHLVPRGILYIEAVAAAGSIQAASREIGISASAIDRQIVLLEDKLGVQLFERQTGGMALSPAGESFLVLARRWRADERRIWSDIKQMQGSEVGHVRLAAMDSMVNGVVPRILSAVFERFPKLQIDVEVMPPDGVPDALTEGEIDLAIAFNVRPNRDLHTVWSETLPLGCVVSPGHPLASEPDTTLKEATRHAIVLQSHALAIRRILEARHGWMFSEGGPPVATNSLQLVKHLAAAGTHVAITSELDAAPEILDGHLVFVPVSDRTASPQSVALVISTRRSLPRVSRIASEIVERVLSDMLAEVRARRMAATGAAPA
ncbi:LysR family transcriptional regulator [Acuticoccus sediminis]|uniref:LysR family transcriptional regulator n=1 Tax=Acuticoccus sediminis TaxID=2184697 RepID=A0A8B2NKQ1_9HYPH|nr:LysR family transcriptional regulator [Acuticoccus sediminis]RAH96725.1 LysR family transcriptional regulator [Acuticoccus sediminis]